MQWIELGRVRSGEVAPEFTLRSGAGAQVTRSQHRQRCNVVLFFIPAASDVGSAVERLAAHRARFDEAGACVYAISAQEARRPASRRCCWSIRAAPRAPASRRVPGRAGGGY